MDAHLAAAIRNNAAIRHALNVGFWRIPLKNSAVQRYGPVSRIFDGPSETTILQRVPRLGPGYAAIISIRALADLNLASRRKFCAVADLAESRKIQCPS